MRKLQALLGIVIVIGVVISAASVATAKPAKPWVSAVTGRTLIKCGKTRGIGLMAPYTGPAASLGVPQVSWVTFRVATWNATHKTKFRIQGQDTMLGSANGTAEAVKGAQALASNPLVLGVVGPAGSNEVIATTPALKAGGLAFITGSATRTSLTKERQRDGYFFRVVPPDSLQSTAVANHIIKTLKFTRVYIIDDQEAYSTGLADETTAKLKAAGVSVGRDGVSQQQADFSALIAKIPRDTQLVYLPWQLPPRAQAFGQQMKQAGKGNIALMGSDGLYDPLFSGLGTNVYDSFFPIAPKYPAITAYTKAHDGKPDYFGAPSYEAANVIMQAIDQACADGTATRAEVRLRIRNTDRKTSLLGLRVKFTGTGDLVFGRFGVWKSNGTDFLPIG
jgi:branched-chain amino acid transport system substrate-binding protein